MRNLLILAVAASFAVACGASRTDDEVGAAPDRGDTTTVTASDTAQAMPTDSTMGQVETDSSYVQQDTTMADPGMSADTTMAEPGMESDTTMAEPSMGADSTQTLPGAESDSVGAEGQVQTDSTSMEMPADTTNQQ